MTLRKPFHLQLYFLCSPFFALSSQTEDFWGRECAPLSLRSVWYQIGLIVLSDILACIKLIGSPTNTFNDTIYSELGMFTIHERTLTSEN